MIKDGLIVGGKRDIGKGLSGTFGLEQWWTRDEGDLELARQYASDVCENSGLDLMTNYEDLFKYKNNKIRNPCSLCSGCRWGSGMNVIPSCLIWHSRPR